MNFHWNGHHGIRSSELSSRNTKISIIGWMSENFSHSIDGGHFPREIELDWCTEYLAILLKSNIIRVLDSCRVSIAQSISPLMSWIWSRGYMHSLESGQRLWGILKYWSNYLVDHQFRTITVNAAVVNNIVPLVAYTDYQSLVPRCPSYSPLYESKQTSWQQDVSSAIPSTMVFTIDDWRSKISR